MQAFPLQWPFGQPRTPDFKRARAAFTLSQDRAQRDIVAEVHRLGGRDLIISTNIAIRKDGLPYTNQPRMSDPGVAVYFTLKGQQKCFACDRWDLLKDNMIAIAKTIEALRGIERWGSGRMVEQAFSGFEALPAPTPSRHWTVVLQIGRNVATRGLIQEKYRELAREAHPDRGGSDAAMSELNIARDQALAEIEVC